MESRFFTKSFFDLYDAADWVVEQKKNNPDYEIVKGGIDWVNYQWRAGLLMKPKQMELFEQEEDVT